MKSKDIVEVFESKKITLKSQTMLAQDEFEILLETLTRNNQIDNIGDYELLALKFDDSETPKFNDNARTMKIDSQDFTIYYSNECPYVEYEVKELSDYAKEKNIKINFIKIDSLEKAKNAPCIFNNWANFYKGEFISNTILNANSFEKLIK